MKSCLGWLFQAIQPGNEHIKTIFNKGIASAIFAKPLKKENKESRWLGSELWTKNMEFAIEFYNRVAGYEPHRVSMVSHDDYVFFVRDEKIRAGIVKIEWDKVQPDWLPYIAVPDVGAVADKAKQWGGGKCSLHRIQVGVTVWWQSSPIRPVLFLPFSNYPAMIAGGSNYAISIYIFGGAHYFFWGLISGCGGRVVTHTSLHYGAHWGTNHHRPHHHRPQPVVRPPKPKPQVRAPRQPRKRK